jgi:hypothetical protein
LTEYTPANADVLLPAFKALSDPGYSYVTNAARYFLIYNKDKVKPADVPRPGPICWIRNGKAVLPLGIRRSLRKTIK